MDKTVGFIGLGIMGNPMCKNILSKGYKLYVYDINTEAVDALVKCGATSCDSPKAVAQQACFIITMLPNQDIVSDAILGDNGVIHGISPGKIVIDMSTIAPDASRNIARYISEVGAAMLDAAVVKSQPAAVTGDLGILVGGDEKIYSEARPVLLCMGKNVMRMGENGKGLAMKLCHNMLVSEISVAVSEMLTLALNEGLEFDDITKAISYGGAQTFYLDSKHNSIQVGDFSPKFPLQYMLKDLRLAEELYGRLNQPRSFRGAELAKSNYEHAVEQGLGKEDFSSIIKVIQS
jgi:3-hydroxyisobutyrate dehydrogenase-like beta-hydroxyacid dehydrogenase